MRHAPLVGGRARIADEAQPAHYAVAIEQHGQDHGMAGHPSSGPAAGVARLVDRLADIFILIVEACSDLVQAVGLGAALAELRPVLELLPRRAAVAAACEIAETVERHGLRLEAELEAADLTGVEPVLRLRRDVGESHRQGEREKARARADHFFIGSHCRVSWPQNSTQSS